MRTLTLLVLLLFSGAAHSQDSAWMYSLQNKGRAAAKKGEFNEAHAAFTELARAAKLCESEFMLSDAMLDLADLHANKAYKGAQPQFIVPLLLGSAKAAARVDYLQREYDIAVKHAAHLRSQEKPVEETRVTDVALATVITRPWWLNARFETQDELEALGLLPRIDEWAAVLRAMKAGQTAAAAKGATEFIARLEKDKLAHSAARARLWLATELSKPAHAGKGGEVSVLKLALAAAEQFGKSGHPMAEFLARVLAAKAEPDAGKALALGLRAWELCRATRQTESDDALDLLELLARIAPPEQRAAFKAEFTESLVRRAETARVVLLRMLREGSNVSKYWRPVLARLRAHGALDNRIGRAAAEIDRLLAREEQLESTPTADQRAAFKKLALAAKKDAQALAALARMAELSGRYEIIDLLFENLASETPLEACAMALETLARIEDMPRLLKLAESKNSLAASCAAATIFRLVGEGAAADLSALLASPEQHALARVWLLGALAARGDESAAAKLRELGAKPGDTAESRHASNSALLVMAALGDVSSHVTLRRRLPPAGNVEFYGRNLARLPVTSMGLLLDTIGYGTLEGARAHWVHRVWRDHAAAPGTVMGPRLLYLVRRDRTEWANPPRKLLEDLERARDDAIGDGRDADGSLYDWAIRREMQDNPESAADHRYIPDDFIDEHSVFKAGEAELNRAPGAASPTADGCWLAHTEGRNHITLSLHKQLTDCTLADNRLSLRISDLNRRINYSDEDGFLRRAAAALDKVYNEAEVRIPGRAALPLSIAFKGYAWRDQERFRKDGVNVPGKITAKVNPERWDNKEYNGDVLFSAELPRDEIGDPLPLELLAQSELVVKVKLFDQTGELHFRLSALRESMVEKPDLVIESFTIEPANPKPGQVLVATLNTINAGRSVTKAGLCTVRFYVKNPQYDSGFRVVAEQQFDPVGWRHGEQKKFTLLPVLCETHFLNTYSHTFVPEAGDVELKVMVDSFDMVEESDNENNISGRTLGWKLEGERAAALAEADLLNAVQPLLDRLRSATTTEDCLAISASLEALFERAQVKTPNTRASLDLCRRVGCAVCYDIDVAAVKRELAESLRTGALTESVLRRLGSRLASAQRNYVASGAPLVLTDLDRARRTTLALSRSAKFTNEAFELGSMLGLTPEGSELPAGSEAIADSLDKIDNALVLARWIDDLRRRNQGDATVKPNTKDAVDAVTSLTGLDVLLHVPKTIFKNLIDYGDRAFNNCSKVMELISNRISGQSTDAEISAAIEELKAGMAPAQLGRDIIKDLGVDTLKKVKVIGPIIDFFVTWFEEDDRYKPN